MRVRPALAAWIGSLTVLSAFGQVDWVPTLSEAMERAQARGCLIVLDVSADWCPPCREMAREVYPDPRFVAFSRNQVFMLVDAYKDREGVKLAERFKVDRFPTILVLDAQAREIERMTGGQSTEELMEALQEILDHPVTAQDLNRAAAQRSDDRELQRRAGQRALQRDDHKRAASFLERAVALTPAEEGEELILLLTQLARASFEAGQFEQCLEVLGRLTAAYEPAREWEAVERMRARSLMNLGRYDEGEKSVMQMLKSRSTRNRQEAEELVRKLPKQYRRDREEALKRVERAEKQARNGRFQEARDLIEPVLATSPDLAKAHLVAADAYFGLAWAAAGSDRPELLRRAYQSARLARRLDPLDPETYFGGRKLLAHLHGVPSEPQDPELRKEFRKAEESFARGNIRDAAERYIRIAQAEPRFAKAYLHLGDCFFDNNQWDKALELYQQAAAIEPRDPAPHRFAADAHLRLGRPDRAREALVEAVLADPDYPLAWADLEKMTAAAGRGLERHDQVIPLNLLVLRTDQDYEATLAGLPSDSAAAWRVYLNCKLQWREQHPDALPADPGEERVCLMRLVDYWSETGSASTRDANLDFLRQIAIDGQLDSFVFLELFSEEYRSAFETWKRDHREPARRYLEDFVFGQAQAASSEGYNLSAVRAFNGALAVHDSDPEQALALYNRALEQEPDMIPAWRNLLILLAGMERYEEASEAAAKWCRLEPESVEAWEQAAMIQIQLGNFQEAVEALEQAGALTEDPVRLERIKHNLEYCRYQLNLLQQ